VVLLVVRVLLVVLVLLVLLVLETMCWGRSNGRPF
jgi:hypothetical protein